MIHEQPVAPADLTEGEWVRAERHDGQCILIGHYTTIHPGTPQVGGWPLAREAWTFYRATPPQPEEPTKLGAVVRVAGQVFVCDGMDYWIELGVDARSFHRWTWEGTIVNLGQVEVLFPGVEPA